MKQECIIMVLATEVYKGAVNYTPAKELSYIWPKDFACTAGSMAWERGYIRQYKKVTCSPRVCAASVTGS